MSQAALDHLVYATPDLEASVAELAGRLGVAPVAGGQHIGHGTRNFLLPFEGMSYLELIGPDPAQPDFAGVRSFGLDTLSTPQLVGWALRVHDIDRFVAEARARGYDPGAVRAMSRRRPDGVVLEWRLTDYPGSEPPVLLPFLIDWGDSPHPASSGEPRATLLDFHIEAREPEALRRDLTALGFTPEVQAGPVYRLVATVRGPSGEVVLQ
jgi:hypothetical protein